MTTDEFETGGAGSAMVVVTRRIWIAPKRLPAQQDAAGLQHPECFRERRWWKVAQTVEAEDAIQAATFQREPRGVALSDVKAQAPRSPRRDMGLFDARRGPRRMLRVQVEETATATRRQFEPVAAAPLLVIPSDLIEHLGVEFYLGRADRKRRVREDALPRRGKAYVEHARAAEAERQVDQLVREATAPPRPRNEGRRH